MDSHVLKEAERAELEKQAKVALLREVLMAHDLKELAQADREKVRRFEEMKIFGRDPGPSKSGDPVGDITIADNIRIGSDPPPFKFPWWLIGPLSTAALGGILWAMSNGPPAQKSADQHWDAITEEQQPDGSWKQIKREHLK
jgi:hypothetical protein